MYSEDACTYMACYSSNHLVYLQGSDRIAYIHERLAPGALTLLQGLEQDVGEQHDWTTMQCTCLRTATRLPGVPARQVMTS